MDKIASDAATTGFLQQTPSPVNQLNVEVVRIINLFQGTCPLDIKSKTGLPDAVTV